MSECLNREWIAANPVHSLEWARGMWWCPCSECARVVSAAGERMLG